MKKRRLLITAYDLNIGGIEKALVSMLSLMDYKKYKVTLILEKKEGILLKEIPKDVIIKEYKINSFKQPIIRKLINRSKLIIRIIINFKKYDFSCSYAPYCYASSILTRYASDNNYLWIHSDYYYVFNKDINKFKDFFSSRQINKFSNIVFVVEGALNNFLKIYPELSSRVKICGNFIETDKIIAASTKKITIKKPVKSLFLNVARHDEKAKKLTRLIIASKKLLDEGYDFEIWMIGSGKDTKMYKTLIKELELEKNIKLLGIKTNPYPYYKKADFFILTSDYEGFPIVYLESLLFNLPIITTIDVLIREIRINNNYGLVVDKTVFDIYKGMKKFLKKGYKLKNCFDSYQYNKDIMNKLESYFNFTD